MIGGGGKPDTEDSMWISLGELERKELAMLREFRATFTEECVTTNAGDSKRLVMELESVQKELAAKRRKLNGQ